jgi:hypothetical protein
VFLSSFYFLFFFSLGIFVKATIFFFIINAIRSCFKIKIRVDTKMICYPRYKVYELYTQQENVCHECKTLLNIHDLEVDNIINGHMVCHDCLKSTAEILSDLEKKESIIDTDLRTITCKMEADHIKKSIMDDFLQNHRFTTKNYGNYTTDFSYVDEANEANEQEEVESDIDPEEKIKSSWYHRAILGDENREIYDDGKDTDFDEVQTLWEEQNLTDSEDEDDYNSQLNLEFK